MSNALSNWKSKKIGKKLSQKDFARIKNWMRSRAPMWESIDDC